MAQLDKQRRRSGENSPNFSPPLRNVKGEPRWAITSQRIKMLGRHSAAPRTIVPPLQLGVILILSPYPVLPQPHPSPHSKSLPPDLPSSLSPSQTPDSLACQWINRRLSVTGGGRVVVGAGGHCMPRQHTNILLKCHLFIPPHLT